MMTIQTAKQKTQTAASVTPRPEAATPATARQWLRRGELLDAARRVFERDGYHGATVSAIVALAGLSQGAFYLYFGDKKAIFSALHAEMATLLRRRIYWATRNEGEPGPRLRAGLRSFFEFYEEYRDYNRRLAIEGLGIDESFEARQRELHETLAAAFAPTFRELGIEAPAMAAFALIGMASQLAYWQHFHLPAEERLTPDQLAQACAGLFLEGARSHFVKGGPHAAGQ
jgi:AcrR family transcriptional regulator